ncbi:MULTISPECIES: lysophospholipid acyltransferase family protein [unclassified Paraflavitalea]|uniref:lysophospholipid acyltransferase family protein n=1 Tax=unclassified Paraflavitalea TaxID=2798305 RepID=UPI003D332F4C
MYYLIFIPLYLLSLLPVRVLYFFGDAIYGVLFYIIGYRKQVVLNNLKIAFPEKSDVERYKIAKGFYHNFIDTFMETIKFITWGEKEMKKRFEADLSNFEKAYQYNKPIHLIGMHNFNWEYVNLGLCTRLKYPFLGIYMPVGNKAFDRIIYNMRSKLGTILIPATDFKNNYLKYASTLHVLGTAADQSPGNPKSAYWTNFFGRPTAFVVGPEKGAKVNDAVILFAHFYKTKRGYYKIDTEFITAEPNSLPQGEITALYAKYIEKCLRQHPSNYLWSHRRWKHEWKDEYGKVIG